MFIVHGVDHLQPEDVEVWKADVLTFSNVIWGFLEQKLIWNGVSMSLVAKLTDCEKG